MLVTMNSDNVKNVYNDDGHIVSDTAALSGEEINAIDAKSAGVVVDEQNRNEIGSDSVAGIAGRKRKTRRFKSRFKNKLRDDKYTKYVVKKMRRARVYPQSEAPYNTNQFLMADHNNMENLAILDDNAAETATTTKMACQSSRNRESSFTSVDTDDDEFYSSPEHEHEFLTKDFDDTYQTLCAEKLGNLSKSQLTKIIFELEAKVDELSKLLNGCSRLENTTNSVLSDRVSTLDANKLLIENQALRLENEGLKRFIKENNVGSVGSRSPSSSSCSLSSSSSSGDSGSVSEHETANSNKTRKVEEQAQIAS